MRVNVYSQEITTEVNAIVKESNTGVSYGAVQFVLHSTDKLHHSRDDDDRSAVTFWVSGTDARREEFAQTLERAAKLVRSLPRGEK